MSGMTRGSGALCAEGAADERAYERLRAALEGADLVLVGASNGLNMSEGLSLFADDEHFRAGYGALAKATGARCLLQGMGSSDPLQRMAWQARFAQREWLDYLPCPAMERLAQVLSEKDSFTLTCNVDGRIVASGVAAARVLETEGSVRQMVCSKRCTDELFPAQPHVRNMVEATSDGRVPESAVPRCPHCDAPLEFAVDEMRLAQPDREAQERVKRFNDLVSAHANGRVVVLELGVGLRNGVIKQALAGAVIDNPNAAYAVFNRDQAVVPKIAGQTLVFEGDLSKTLAKALGV